MVSPTTTAIIASSAASSAATSSHLARVNRCEGIVDRFDSLTATTEQQVQYADCVHFLHPSVDSAPIELKIFIVCLFAAVLAGAGIGAAKSDPWLCGGRWFGAAIGSLVGIVGALVLTFVILLLAVLAS